MHGLGDAGRFRISLRQWAGVLLAAAAMIAAMLAFAPKAVRGDAVPPEWPPGAELTVAVESFDPASETYSVVLSWPAALGDVAGYEILKYEGGQNPEYLDEVSDTTFTVSLLEPSTAYEFQVIAHGADESSTEPLTATFIVPPPAAPSWVQPAEIAFSNETATSVTIEWPAAVYDYGTVKYLLTIRKTIFDDETNGLAETPAQTYSDLSGTSYTLVIEDDAFSYSIGAEAYLDGYSDIASPMLIAEYDPPVIFRDEILEEEVRYILDIYDDPVPRKEMLDIEYLNIYELGITDLFGLEYAKKLTELDIESNHISDLSPLSGLNNLLTLRAAYNQIEDLTPLENSRVNELDVSFNRITNLSPLLTMKNNGAFASGGRINIYGNPYTGTANQNVINSLLDVQGLVVIHNGIVNYGDYVGLAIDKPQKSVKKDDHLTLTVSVNTNEQQGISNLYGFVLELQYDPEEFQPYDPNPDPGQDDFVLLRSEFKELGDAASLYWMEIEEGRIRVIATLHGEVISPPPPNPSFPLAEFHFTALSSGGGTFTILNTYTSFSDNQFMQYVQESDAEMTLVPYVEADRVSVELDPEYYEEGWGPIFPPNSSVRLRAQVNPDATYQQLDWSSSDPLIASPTVSYDYLCDNGYRCTWFEHKGGTGWVTITVTTEDGATDSIDLFFGGDEEWFAMDTRNAKFVGINEHLPVTMRVNDDYSGVAAFRFTLYTEHFDDYFPVMRAWKPVAMIPSPGLEGLMDFTVTLLEDYGWFLEYEVYAEAVNPGGVNLASGDELFTLVLQAGSFDNVGYVLPVEGGIVFEDLTMLAASGYLEIDQEGAGKHYILNGQPNVSTCYDICREVYARVVDPDINGTRVGNLAVDIADVAMVAQLYGMDEETFHQETSYEEYPYDYFLFWDFDQDGDIDLPELSFVVYRLLYQEQVYDPLKPDNLPDEPLDLYGAEETQ